MAGSEVAGRDNAGSDGAGLDHAGSDIADAEADARPLTGRVRLSAALAGLLFGLGLAIAGMTDPRKVLAFLDLAGDWDPSLMVVLAVAVGGTAAGYRVVLRRPAPRCAPAFDLPARQRVDGRLLAGSALFGAGWGWAGYCPGPALAGLAMGAAEAWIFVPAMLAAGGLTRAWMRRRDRHAGTAGAQD